MSETVIRYVPELGRRVREGTWEDQGISGYWKMQEAIRDGRWDKAAQLGNYFVDEALVCYQLYRQWVADLLTFLRQRGVEADELAQVDSGIVTKLGRPDGRPFDRNFMWNEFREGVESFVAHCHREQGDEALQNLDTFVETWRQLHDRDVDHTYGLMHEVVERAGEPAIGEMYDVLLIPLFTWRYEKFDIDKHPWTEGLRLLMQVCFEAARSHLFGPGRRGDMEVIEYDDRFVLRFDPCGSGGRTVRGDGIEGTPPRMEAPYNWRVSKEPHSWNHFQEGVCLLQPLHQIDGGDADRPLRLSGSRRRSAAIRPRPARTRAEVSVHDVQGSDERARRGLRARRPDQGRALRLDSERRSRASGRRHQPPRVRMTGGLSTLKT